MAAHATPWRCRRVGGGLLAAVGGALATGWWWQLVLLLQPIIGRRALPL